MFELYNKLVVKKSHNRILFRHATFMRQIISIIRPDKQLGK